MYLRNARWMNGQHLRSLPLAELTELIGKRWKSCGILTKPEGLFVEVSFIWLATFPILYTELTILLIVFEGQNMCSLYLTIHVEVL